MIKLFSGTANSQLSSKVAKILKLPISKSEIVRFGSSEVRVRIEENVRNKTCFIIQSTSNPTDNNLIELFLFCDALRRQEAAKVIGIIPYFGYARQDIQHRTGECVSANVVIRFLESIGFYKIYTVDIHDEATEGVFSIPFKNLTALTSLSEKINKYLKKNYPKLNPVIVSPDQGGIERARKFGINLLGHENFSITVIEKKRNLSKTNQSKALDIYGNVNHSVAILVDDIATSGSTLVNAAQLCLEKGAKAVLAAIVHHDFLETTPKKINQSLIEKFFTTDTIFLEKKHKFKKLNEISIAPLLAKEIKAFM